MVTGFLAMLLNVAVQVAFLVLCQDLLHVSPHFKATIHINFTESEVPPPRGAASPNICPKVVPDRWRCSARFLLRVFPES